MAEVKNKVGIDDIMEAATHGVLRALEARKISAANLTVKDLVSSSYRVEVILRAGGFPGPIDPSVLTGVGAREVESGD